MKRWHYLVFIISFLYIVCISFNRIGGNPRGVIWSDCEGYYLYLPGLFIIKDFHKLDAGSMWPYYNDRHEFVDKYSCGVAYFELPFFGIGYLLTKFEKGDVSDFFGPVYSKSIAIGGILASFLGLLITFKTLLRYEIQ